MKFVPEIILQFFQNEVFITTFLEVVQDKKVSPLNFNFVSISTGSLNSRQVVRDQKDSFSQEMLLLLNFTKRSEKLQK